MRKHALRHLYVVYVAKPHALPQDYFPVTNACPMKQKLGKEPRTGDHGKWVCGVKTLLQKPGCIVYSVGSKRPHRSVLSIWHCLWVQLSQQHFGKAALIDRRQILSAVAMQGDQHDTTPRRLKSQLFLLLRCHHQAIGKSLGLACNNGVFSGVLCHAVAHDTMATWALHEASTPVCYLIWPQQHLGPVSDNTDGPMMRQEAGRAAAISCCCSGHAGHAAWQLLPLRLQSLSRTWCTRHSARCTSLTPRYPWASSSDYAWSRSSAFTTRA